VPKLTIDRVSKRYRLEREARDVPAFAEVTLSVEEGEFVSIVGPSGCGKTSLLNVVAGLLLSTRAGQIDGRPSPDRAPIAPWSSSIRASFRGARSRET
jgi:NitT/TauT family transport system ATP-binding protein